MVCYKGQAPNPEKRPIKQSSNTSATEAKTVKPSSVKPSVYTRQGPRSRFDRIEMEMEVNGFKLNDRVVLKSTGSLGFIRWIGCYHDKKPVGPSDFIVGVEVVRS